VYTIIHHIFIYVFLQLQLSDAYSKPMNISIEMLKEEEIINDAEIEPPVTPISESALGEITEEM